MLAKDAPWWAGERGNLPHAAGDNRPAYNNGQPTGANANNWRQYQPGQYPTQQGGQQASPYKTPDMSAYSQSGSAAQSPYARYGVPPLQGPGGGWTPPKGARQNDLSGQVPANQIWAQAYNQASKQYGGNTQAQSWTMPGSYNSQSYNPATGQYSQPTGGQSWDGNMAYNAMDQRPGPIQANATGVGGNQMQWQDAMRQREAFVGNLSERLNQYSGGQLTGPVTFDPSQLLSQADEQLAKGTFVNPFSGSGRRAPGPDRPEAGYATKPPSQWTDADWAGYQQEQDAGPMRDLVHKPRYYRDEQGNARYSSGGHFREDPMDADVAWQRTRSGVRPPVINSQGSAYPPDFQQAMNNSIQYMQGNFQNPFGNSPAANNPRPSWGQQSYDPRPQYEMSNDAPGIDPRTGRYNPGFQAPSSQSDTAYAVRPQDGFVPGVNYSTPWRNDPTRPLPPGYKWQKVAEGSRSEGWLPVSDSEAAAQPSEDSQRAEEARLRQMEALGIGVNSGSTSSVGDAFAPERQSPPPVRTAPGAAQPIAPQSQGTPYNPQAGVQGFPDVPQAPDQRQAQLSKIDNEIRKWQAATYGTWQGSGPPAEWRSHIQALQRLRGKAAAGDPAALAWNPKMKAPPAHQSQSFSRPDRGGFNNRKFTGVAGNARPTGYSWN